MPFVDNSFSQVCVEISKRGLAQGFEISVEGCSRVMVNEKLHRLHRDRWLKQSDG